MNECSYIEVIERIPRCDECGNKLIDTDEKDILRCSNKYCNMVYKVSSKESGINDG